MYLKILNEDNTLNEDINWALAAKSAGVGMLAGAPVLIIGALIEKKKKEQQLAIQAKNEAERKLHEERIAKLEAQISELKKKQKS